MWSKTYQNKLIIQVNKVFQLNQINKRTLGNIDRQISTLSININF